MLGQFQQLGDRVIFGMIRLNTQNIHHERQGKAWQYHREEQHRNDHHNRIGTKFLGARNSGDRKSQNEGYQPAHPRPGHHNNLSECARRPFMHRGFLQVPQHPDSSEPQQTHRDSNQRNESSVAEQVQQPGGVGLINDFARLQTDKPKRQTGQQQLNNLPK